MTHTSQAGSGSEQPTDVPPTPPNEPSVPTPTPSNEAPDRDTPAWEGAEPTDAVGLVDPRHEIRTPPGL